MSKLTQPVAQPLAGGRRSSVFVLEPDRQVRSLLSEWLEAAGYSSIEAYTAAASAEAIPRCDIALVDVRSPLRSAKQLIDCVTVAVPEAALIAMSADGLASGESATDEVATELGVAAVLLKPFGRDALMRALQRARTAI